jgi:RNA polymerase sigma-70 factor (ECF subfamily)
MQAPSFQTFYRENLGLIYRFVYGKMGNREEAEDLTSQIFLKAVRSLDYEQSPQRARKWLFQVARTTIADYWRVHYRSGMSIGLLDDLLEAGWEDPAEVEPLQADDNAAERVRQILLALCERDRETLTCRFLLNLSLRETAERLGMTEQNVKIVQFRALKRAAQIEATARESVQ